MHTVMPLRGLLALGAALLALLAGGLALPHAADAAFTDNTDCKGSLKVGEKSADFDNPISYRIACSNYITSYAILLPGRQIDAIETEVFGLDRTTNQVVANDAFSCNGDLPGWGINCVGSYGGKYNVLPGNVNVVGDVCAPTASNASLVVTYATYVTNADGSAKLSGGVPTVTTSTAGPFDLGKVQGCPKPSAAKAATKPRKKTAAKHR